MVWQLDPETLQVRHTWYGRSLIRSRYKMFYAAAQRLVDGDPAEALAQDVPEWTELRGQQLQDRSAAAAGRSSSGSGHGRPCPPTWVASLKP